MEITTLVVIALIVDLYIAVNLTTIISYPHDGPSNHDHIFHEFLANVIPYLTVFDICIRRR